MDNVHNCDSYINIDLIYTFIFYTINLYYRSFPPNAYFCSVYKSFVQKLVPTNICSITTECAASTIFFAVCGTNRRSC
jgi:hypothetical protein